MANQLEGNNTQQKLIGGAARQPQRQARNEDVFVANVGEKRYLWTARAFAIITAISLCCNIVLILAIMQVLPLYRVEPFCLRFKTRKSRFTIFSRLRGAWRIKRPLPRSLSANMCCCAVLLTAMCRRWRRAGCPAVPCRRCLLPLSIPNFWKNGQKALDLIRVRSLQRNVRILTVNELGRGLWQVEYETQDMYPDSPAPEVNYWTASLRIAYNRKSVKYGERLKNPVGFTVVRYSLTYNKVK